MSIVTVILIVVATALLIVLVAAAFQPDSYTIERSIVIHQPKQRVFDFIKIMKNQSLYNKWVMTDPNQRTSYRGTDGTIGFVTAWDSDNKQVGKGEQEITGIDNGNRIDWEIRFEKPFKNTSRIWITTETVSPTQTKVTWMFRGALNYMMKIMHMFLNFKKILGKDIETSLNNLKQVLEKS